MDFKLSDEQVNIKNVAAEFAKNELYSDPGYGDVVKGFRREIIAHSMGL